jgi:uncharacterized membrane protein YjjB (DUF3815 family)
MLGVVYDEAVDNTEPDVATLYQAKLALVTGVAVKVKVPVPHRVFPVAAGAAGWALTVTTAAVRETDKALVSVFLASA